MDIIKLLCAFALIVLMLAWKKPLSLAMITAGIAVILLYQLPLDVTVRALWKGLTGHSTIKAVLILYSVTYLQRMLEKRGDLRKCQAALNGLFNDRRINASLAPCLLGCLPGGSTVLICGPIVRDSVGALLSPTETAAVTSFFRHIPESFLPTFTSVSIALELTDGRVKPGTFILAMIPTVIALFATGWLVYLRKLPKDTGTVADQPKKAYWLMLLKSVWTIALSILIILVTGLPVYGAVAICVLINFFVGRFKLGEAVTFLRTAFELRLIANIVMVMLFKELLDAAGVIAALPGIFSRLPIPSFLVFALIFFFGSIIASLQAITVLCLPIAVASVGVGPFLSLFVLMMSMGYAAMQLSPVHVCLTLCAEDHKVPLGPMIWKTVPMVGVFSLLSFLYYFVLSAVGL